MSQIDLLSTTWLFDSPGEMVDILVGPSVPVTVDWLLKAIDLRSFVFSLTSSH